MTTNPPEVRGARDLAALWRTLPAAVLRYRASTPPDLARLSDTLRARAWREHCAAPTPPSCVELGRDCPIANGDCCRADALFPMRLGGGAQKWRMATLFVQWWPSMAALHLIAVGETACREIGWAARCLRERHDLDTPERLAVACFGDLELRKAARWRLRFVTPWVVGKEPVDRISDPDAATIARELCKSMRARAHKLTALCTHDSVWQRLGGHLVHHVADALLPALAVEQASIVERPDSSAGSVSNGNTYQELTWSGEATLYAGDALLPWLSLLAVCGGGENADKGKGRVELLPLP